MDADADAIGPVEYAFPARKNQRRLRPGFAAERGGDSGSCRPELTCSLEYLAGHVDLAEQLVRRLPVAIVPPDEHQGAPADVEAGCLGHERREGDIVDVLRLDALGIAVGGQLPRLDFDQ